MVTKTIVTVTESQRPDHSQIQTPPGLISSSNSSEWWSLVLEESIGVSAATHRLARAIEKREAMAARMVVRVAVAVLLAAATVADGRDFHVGGRAGWAPNPAEPFNTWAERNRFQVNDTLVFRYNKDADAVLVVTQSHYDACNATEPVLRLAGGDSRFVFSGSGPYFFISADEGRCRAGERLIVVVLAVRNTSGGGNTPSPKPSSSPPPVATPAPRASPPPPSPPKSSSSSPPPPKSSPSSPPTSPPPVPAPAPHALPPPPNASSPAAAPAPAATNVTSSPPSPPSSAAALRGGVLACLIIGGAAILV